MSTLGSFLQAAVGPLARRGAAALGFGVVTYIGVDTAISGLLASARSAWSGMGADVLAYLALAGAHESMAIIAGAITARLTLLTLKRMALL